MRRFYPGALAGMLLFNACTIERTPLSYIDHQAIPEELIAASHAELDARLHATARALEQGALEPIISALRPAPGAVLYAPESEEALTSPEGMAIALAALAVGGRITPLEPEVRVGPANDLAWSRVLYQVHGAQGERQLRFTAVWARREGGWSLVQGHLSSVPVPLVTAPPAAG